MTAQEKFWYASEALKAITPIGIGAFAGYIAWRQWRTSKLNLSLNLFDRRFKVYEATKKMFDDITNHVDVPSESMKQFLTDTAQARFLFPKKLMEYLDTLRSYASDLRANARRYDVAVQRNDQKLGAELTDREAELCDKVAKAEESLVKNFEPYLDLRHVR
jgi:hypothetical protein